MLDSLDGYTFIDGSTDYVYLCTVSGNLYINGNVHGTAFISGSAIQALSDPEDIVVELNSKINTYISENIETILTGLGISGHFTGVTLP